MNNNSPLYVIYQDIRHKANIVRQLLIAAALTVCYSAFVYGAPAKNAGPPVVYICVAGGQTGDQSSRGCVLQYHQLPNGTLQPMQPPRVSLTSVPRYCRYVPRLNRIYVQCEAGYHKPGPVAVFSIGQHGELVRPTKADLPVVPSYEVVVSPDGSKLFVIGADRRSIFCYSVTSDGCPRFVSVWRLPSGHKPAVGASIANDSNAPVLQNLMLNGLGTSLYVVALRLTDLASSSIMQFHIARSASISPLSPFELRPASASLVFDSNHGYIYGCNPALLLELSKTRRGGANTQGRLLNISEYLCAPDGQMAPVLLPREARMAIQGTNVQEKALSRPGGSGNGDLLPLYPSPANRGPTPPPISVSAICLACNHKVLLGFGGLSGNEIEIWQTSNAGIGRLDRRYWYDEAGIRTTPDIPTSEPQSILSSGIAYPCIDASGARLYVWRQSINPSTGRANQNLYCFSIQASGGLSLLASHIDLGIDLDSYAFCSMVIVPG